MREQDKNTKYKNALAVRRIKFLPFTIEFYGGFGALTERVFKDLGFQAKQKLNREVEGLMRSFQQCISFIHRKSYIHSIFSQIK